MSGWRLENTARSNSFRGEVVGGAEAVLDAGFPTEDTEKARRARRKPAR